MDKIFAGQRAGTLPAMAGRRGWGEDGGAQGYEGVATEQEAVRDEQVNDAVDKILDALRINGYKPHFLMTTTTRHQPPMKAGG